MKKYLSIVFLATAIISAACTKDSLPNSQKESNPNIVNLTIHATKDFEFEGEESKVSYNSETNSFAFETGDKLRLLIGKVNGSTLESQKRVTLELKEGTSNTFSGTVDLTGYSISDIRGAVLARDNCPDNKYILAMNGSTLCAVFGYLQNQTQGKAGSLTDETGRYMFYAPITSSMISGDSENVVISDLTLKLITPLWEYRIYGSDRSAEKILSVNVTINTQTAAQSIALSAHRIVASSAGHNSVSTSSPKYSGTVSLSTPSTVASSLDDAKSAPVWHCVYGRNKSGATAKTLKTITVTTDKAVYTRSFAGSKSQNAWMGYVHPININIGSDGSFMRTTNFEYSTDGKVTWVSWDGALPSGTTYTQLAVRAKGSQKLSSTSLTEIKNWIFAQESPVALDLSGVDYTSTEFPKVFGASSENANSKKLASIILPSNITELENGAFRWCANMTSINLDNVTTLNDFSFNRCGSLSNLGNTTKLKTIGYQEFSFTAISTIDLTGITGTIGTYNFRLCTQLTEVIIGSACTKVGGYAFSGCEKLDHIWCHAATPPDKTGDFTAFDTFSSDKVPGYSVSGEGHKQIHVPAASLATYQASPLWGNSVTGYTLVAISE